jgi:hypothetical protein
MLRVRALYERTKDASCFLILKESSDSSRVVRMFSCKQNNKQKAVETMQGTWSWKRWSISQTVCKYATHHAGRELADCSDESNSFGGVGCNAEHFDELGKGE